MCKTEKLELWALFGVTLLSIVSQTSFFVESSLVSYLTTPIWVLLFFYLLLQAKGKIHIDYFQMTSATILALIGIMSVFDSSYVQTRIFRQIVVAALIYTCGSMVNNKSDEALYVVGWAFICGAFILAVNTAITYLSGGSFAGGTTQYAYNSKNSSAQILLSALIIGVSIVYPRTRKKVPVLAILGSTAIIMFMMASRATIICIPFIVIYLLFSSHIRMKQKFWILGGLLGIMMIILNNEQLLSSLYSILTGNRSIYDLNALSSGRAGEWQQFFREFPNYMILGAGKYKIESFPLSVLFQYGLFVGTAIIALGCTPLIACFTKCNRRLLNTTNWKCLVLLSIVYLVNGVFEELSPFGPGIKCFSLWFVAGILFAHRKRDEEEMEYEQL